MFTIKRCTSSDLEEVNYLLREVYYPEEPLTKANRLCPEPTLAAAILPQGHSCMAVASDGRVIGVALNDEPPQVFPTIYTELKEDVKFRELFAYMEEVSGVLDAAPEAMEIKMIAVDKDWRGQGVATSLLAASRMAAQEAGCPWLKLYCTSNYSSRLMEKLGWQLLYSLDYSVYGRQSPEIVMPGPPHTSCNLYIDKVCLPKAMPDLLDDRLRQPILCSRLSAEDTGRSARPSTYA